MAENITPEEYRAEISMLNHEIYQLQKQLRQKEEDAERGSILDKYNPFDNPTDYHHYNGDYTEIVPQAALPGCKIPVEPNRSETKRLRRFYTIGGTSLLCHFIFSFVLAMALTTLVTVILQLKNPGASYDAVYSYATSSSILVAITAITYMIANVGFSFMGLKWAKIGVGSLFRTKNFSAAKAAQYCFAGVFVQYGAALITTLITVISEKFGYSVESSVTDDFASSGMGFVLMTIYSCIIAPITEELLFRGMLLKTFSRANQRFATVATAIFFGLTHGNIPQFMLGFLVGIFLAHITLKHDSLIPAIITHMFINTTATVINELSTRYESSNTTQAILNLIYILMAIVGLIMFIEFSLKSKLPATTPQQSRRGFLIACTSVPVLLVFFALTGSMLFTFLSTKLVS